MKILIISQYFWPENFKINDLAISLQKRGHEVTILTGKPNYPNGSFYSNYGFFSKRKEFYHGIKILRTPIIPRGNGNSFSLIINYFSFVFFSSISVLFRLNKDRRLIFVYEPSPITVGIPAIIYKFFSKAQIFFWVQDLWPESLSATGNIKSKLLLRNIERLVKFIYKNSSIIFISSRNFKKSILEKGVQESKIVYLPNWAEDIYLEKFTQKDEVKRKFPESGFKVVFAGNIGDAQDFESLINAVELTKPYIDIHWIIIGDGRKKNWVEKQKMLKELSNLHLIGRFDINEMPYFFNEADVLLVSLRDEYIFSLTVPSKIQSYMAFGKPIIAMINGEGADIIFESNAGFAVNAGDFKKLSEIVVKMSSMSDYDLNTMSNNAKIYYHNNFDKETQVNKILDLVKYK